MAESIPSCTKRDQQVNCFLLEKSTTIIQGYSERGASGTTLKYLLFHEVFDFTSQEEAMAPLYSILSIVRQFAIQCQSSPRNLATSFLKY